MARDTIYLLGVLAERYPGGGSPVDYLYPGERNPFFRLAFNLYTLTIQSEYDTHRNALRDKGGDKASVQPKTPEEMQAQWEAAVQAQQ